MNKLSQSTIEALQYYVYLLIDPRTDKPFYVGKGVGNRVNAHVLGALDTELDEVEKIKTIHEIQKADHEVKHVILRHGLTEKEAFEVESAVIDVIGMQNLTNIVAGHYASDRGLMSLEDIAIKYQAEDAEFDSPAMLINLNRLYYAGISADELYEITRKHWRISFTKVQSINLVCGVYAGIIREVYIVENWLKSGLEYPGRIYFEGRIADQETRSKYINKSATKYIAKGNQNPIKYVGIIET